MNLARKSLKSVEPNLNRTNTTERVYYTFGEIEVKNSRKLFLLGKFDPLFVSYRHKDWIVTEEQQKQIWRNAGHVEAVIFEGAKLLGTWRHSLKGDKLTISVEPMASTITDKAKEKIQSKAEKLARFWRKELESVIYV